MDIKYTIEILTKDIQDIAKLVAALRNSKDASAIELDLALSKMRNVYEILTMIKADRLYELATGSAPAGERSAPEGGGDPGPFKEPVLKSGAVQEALTEDHAEEPDTAETLKSEVQEEAAEKEDAAKEEQAPKNEEAAEKEETAEKEEGTPVREHAGTSILAEKFSAEASINENLGDKRGKDDDAKLLGQPIDNISRNIGINDRFLIIRELFEGEAERFTILLNELDNAENFEAASNLLNKQFAGNMDHEGVEILKKLLKRRFIR